MADIRRGIQVLEAQLARVDRKHAAYCIAKLMAGFNERLTSDEARLRAEVWLEACGDIPNDLWSAGTLELLRTWKRDDHYGRVPEAADLRGAVDRVHCKRAEDLRRLKTMLAKAGQAKTVETPQEPIEHRLRHKIWRGWEAKVGGQHFMAARMWTWAQQAEQQLAKIEGREPAVWAIVTPSDLGEKVNTGPTARPMPSPGEIERERRLAELAVAARLGRKPPPPPEPPRDVPEAAHG